MSDTSIILGPPTNNKGEKWFGVQIVDCLGLHMLVHIIKIEALGFFAVLGWKVLLSIVKALSINTLTGGYKEIIFVPRTVAASMV